MSDTLESTQSADTTTIEIPANPLGMNAGGSAPITKVSPDQSSANMPDWMKQSAEIIAEVPAYLGQIYGEYKSTINTVALFFGILVGAKLTLAVLSAVNEIPLLAPTFELIGIGYTVWFVWRYLLQASTRSELTSEIDGLKSEIFGDHKK
jgi:CAAD domains of cyanobacterial aminoacyl-tRNA synthetase